VAALTRRVLEFGGEVVVFAGNEPRLDETDPATAQVFDWTVIDELYRVAAVTDRDRQLGVVVTSTRPLAERVTKDRREKLEELMHRGMVGAVVIPQDRHVGGHIRATIAELSHGLVAVGGGRGVLDLHAAFTSRSLPVLPIGLDVGASCEDGEGALGLYRRALVSPENFFSPSPEKLRKLLLTRGLADDTQDPNASAVAIVALLDEGLDTTTEVDQATQEVGVLVLGVLPVELRALMNVLRLKGPGFRSRYGVKYWTTQLVQEGGAFCSVAVAAVGSAGNTPTAAAVTELTRELSPRLVVLAGIAAGQRGKYRIGEVVLSEAVVAYEPAALVDSPGQPRVPRATAIPVSFSLQQDLTAYVAREPEARLDAEYKKEHIELSRRSRTVTDRARVRLATIGSGEKLVRDPAFLAQLQAQVHGKIDVLEMEAAGLVAACHVVRLPFLVIRGISDFANSKKNNRHHELAAQGAAIVTRDFLIYGLELPDVREML
jgi:nucleoside phosphorylase